MHKFILLLVLFSAQFGCRLIHDISPIASNVVEPERNDKCMGEAFKKIPDKTTPLLKEYRGPYISSDDINIVNVLDSLGFIEKDNIAKHVVYEASNINFHLLCHTLGLRYSQFEPTLSPPPNYDVRAAYFDDMSIVARRSIAWDDKRGDWDENVRCDFRVVISRTNAACKRLPDTAESRPKESASKNEVGGPSRAAAINESKDSPTRNGE